MDHPRSRGVYDQVDNVAAAHEGSSPLARGLPERKSEAVYGQGSSPLARGLHVGARRGGGGVRIIPARAGFTRRWSVVVMWCSGSSPLARGLRQGHLPGGRELGIIPARAGFTCSRRRLGRAIRDHPRSRGVYLQVIPQQNMEPGSSPLARGLHSLPLVFSLRLGIIPARAGFTEGGDEC